MRRNIAFLLFMLVVIPLLAMGAWYPFNPRNGDMQTDAGGLVRAQQCHVAHFEWASPDVAAATAVCNVTPTAAIARVVTGATLTQPDDCRCLAVKAPTTYSGVVTVTGTNIAGQIISETFTLSGTSATNGDKAFKTVTAVTVPANEQIQVGTTDKLGLPYKANYIVPFAGFRDGSMDSSPPNVTSDPDKIELNTSDPYRTMNGTKAEIIFTWY